MKKWSSLLLAAILIASLAGCGGGQKAEQNTDAPTAKLVVYVPPSGDPMFANVIKTAYRKMQDDYPDIEFDVHDYSADWNNAEAKAAYYDMLKQELAAGKGPDLIIDYSTNLGDLYKLMASGALYDINRFLSYDEQFDLSLYNEKVMEAGIYKGERLAVPFSYFIPSVVTTEENLAFAGIPREGIDTLQGFLRAATEYQARSDPETDPRVVETKYVFRRLLHHAGYQCIDFQNNALNIETDDFRQIMELGKLTVSFDRGIFDRVYITRLIPERHCLFSLYADGISNLPNDSILRGFGQTPAIFPLKTSEGDYVATANGVIAIPAASANKVNAYRLLQYMLSEDIQKMFLGQGMPVRKNELEASLEQLIVKKKYTAGTAPNTFVVEVTSQETVDAFYQAIENIGRAVLIQQYIVDTFVLPEMEPYFNGTDSYENRLQKLKNKLTLYLNE